jgi:hypothetical protein
MGGAASGDWPVYGAAPNVDRGLSGGQPTAFNVAGDRATLADSTFGRVSAHQPEAWPPAARTSGPPEPAEHASFPGQGLEPGDPVQWPPPPVAAQGATLDRAGREFGLRRGLAAVSLLSLLSSAAVLVAGFLVQSTNDRPSAEASAPARAPATQVRPPIAAILLTPHGTATSPVIWQASPRQAAVTKEVLAGYQAYFGTVVRLNEEPDPDDPALPQIAIGPELVRVHNALSAAASAGQSRHGRITASAMVQSLRGTDAIVLSCADLSRQRMSAAGGARPVAARRPTAMAVRMRRDDGRWKVYGMVAVPATRCMR